MNTPDGDQSSPFAPDSVRVLLVDADADSAGTTAACLERTDAQVDVVTETSADEGLERLGAEPIDCVVSGYRLSAGNGLEFLDAVRDDHPDLPFVLFTADGSEDMAADALRAGATDYLPREEDSDQSALLAERIWNAVERFRAQRQSRLLRTAVDTVSDGISVFDDDGRFVYANEAYADRYGYDADALIGEYWEQVHPEAEAAFVHSEAIPAVEEAGSRRGPTSGRRADGTTFPADRAATITDDGVVCTVRTADSITSDAYERKLEQLHAATRDLIAADTRQEVATVAIEAAGDVLDFPINGVHLYDEDHDGLMPVAVSESGRALLGDPPTLDDTSLAWAAFRCGEPQVYGDVRKVDEVYDSDTPIRSEMHLPLGDHGVFIPSSTRTDTFDDADVTLAKILAANVTTALDRTAHVRKLERLQDRSRELMDTTTVDETTGVAVDAAHEILDAALSGFYRVVDDGQRLEPTTASNTGSAVFETPPTYDRTEAGPVARFVWDVFDDGEPVYVPVTADRSELRGETPAGSAIVYPIDDHGVFIVSWQDSAAFTDSDTKLVDILASELTVALQRVERESVLRDRSAELEHQNDRLERFAGIVSHDLRNPLSVANGRLELAQLECDSEHLDEVADALARMGSIVEGTLTLARQGGTVDELEHCPLGSLAADCWAHVTTAEATLLVDDDVAIRGDSDRVRQVFENLYRNAVEHGDDGPVVRVGALEDGFYVADDGPGVPEPERDQIFDWGYSTTDDGSGFGLPIVREICEAHGWTISAGESDDGGARFEITGVEFA